MTYCGSYSPPSTALQLALGNMDIHTLAQVTTFCPDNPPFPSGKPRYGTRAGHSSVWCKGYQGVGRGDGNGDKVPESASAGFSFEMGGGCKKSIGGEVKGVEKKCSVIDEVIKVARGGEKRKSEVVTEDKIAEMLSGEMEKSPPLKKVKLGTEKFSKLKKLVGVTENSARPGVVTVSKYFVGSEPARINHKDNDTAEAEAENDKNEDSPEVKNDTIARGRRLSTGNSGAWFKDIEQPSTLQGKFIYRAEPALGVREDGGTDSVTVLKEISNSPGALGDDLERKKRRNPFAVKLQTKECTALPSCSPPTPTSPPPVSEILPSSQLSLFSIDGSSLTFSTSSQELTDSQDIPPAKSISSPPRQVSPPPPVRQVSSPPASAPRLGLNKFAFRGGKTVSSSVSKQAPKNNFVPARVSGLSRGGGGAGKGGGGGMKQS